MSTAQSIGAKERWDKCRIASIKLGCGKTHVHDRLYSRMLKEELLDRVCDGDEDAIAQVQAWSEFNEERQNGWCGDNSPIDKLKLTDWFVRKVGGIEKALKLLDYYTKLEAIK